MSELKHSKPQSGGAFPFDGDDFPSLLREPSNISVKTWRNGFVFDGVHSDPAPILPTVSQHHIGQDLIFVDTGFDFAKGGSGGGSSGGTTGGFIATPYTAGGAATNYNITIQFKGTWTEDLYNGFKAAADLLCKYITGDVKDVFSRGKVIDDIVITAELKAIDGEGGILGQAGPTAIRSVGYLPATATMQFDIADASYYQSRDLWDDIVTHEMLHSIGFGTIWSYLGYVTGSTFTGPRAEEVYGDPVPLEQTGGSGTAGSHWDEEIFRNELMTGYIGYLDPETGYAAENFISNVTWASLEDLGYALNPYPARIVMNYPDYLLA